MEEFVILHHQMLDDSPRPSHWDLMFQQQQELLTWAIKSNPFEVFDQIPVRRLPNHRLEYLNYEGEISGGRGMVKQLAKGKFRWVAKQDLNNWTASLVLQAGSQCTVQLQDCQTISFSWKQLE